MQATLMREAAALIRASWLTATSYRLSMAISLASLVITVVPIYFVANALHPVLSDAIQNQGSDYFAFLIVGMVAFLFLPTSLNALPRVIGSGINTGTLEALLATPVPLPKLLVGLCGYEFLWTAIRALILALAGAAFGASLAWERLPTAVGIMALIILAHIPFSLLAASLILMFRTSGPLSQIVLAVSGLLGGVYYPTKVIPSWIQHVSDVIPLTYGLRALRQTILEGMPLGAVLGDLAILLGFVVVLLLLGTAVFSRALRYARRAGTLGHY